MRIVQVVVWIQESIIPLRCSRNVEFLDTLPILTGQEVKESGGVAEFREGEGGGGVEEGDSFYVAGLD